MGEMAEMMIDHMYEVDQDMRDEFYWLEGDGAIGPQWRGRKSAYSAKSRRRALKKNGIWIDGNDRGIHISDIEDSHLSALIRYLTKRSPDEVAMIRVLVEEQDKRLTEMYDD